MEWLELAREWFGYGSWRELLFALLFLTVFFNILWALEKAAIKFIKKNRKK